MPSEVSMSGARHDREPTVEELKRDLVEARRREAATTEILKVISQSKFNLQKVLDTLIETAARLCDADIGVLRRRMGDVYELAASYGLKPEWRDALARLVPNTPGHRSVVGRAMLEMRTVQTPDCLGDPELLTNPQLAQTQKLIGYRAILVTPLQREGESIGAIALFKLTPGQFSPREISLIETFADQAVIAIENTRLFEAEQASKHELQESLEYQTATGEILAVISRSPSKVQPVFDAIVKSSLALCNGRFSALFQFDGELIHPVAAHNLTPEALETMKRMFPARPTRTFGVGRAIVSNAVVHIPDVESDPEHQIKAVPRAIGWRSGLFVPMLRDAAPVGVIVVARAEPGPFTDRQIELLKTFADQAVIAVENTRLFEAEQASKRELQQSLEYQTAISEVLAVISRSPTDIQPVLDVVARNAARLCDAEGAAIFHRDGEQLLIVARHSPMRHRLIGEVSVPLIRGTINGRAVLEARTLQISDLQSEGKEYPESSEHARRFGHRTVLAVPLLRDGVAIGSIGLRRTYPQLFTDAQVALIETFADQAVIAIENTRLFEAEQASKRELTEALEQQTATADVLKVISRSALDVQKVLDALVESAARLCEAYDAAIFQVVGNNIRLVAHHGQIPMVGPVGQLTLPLVRAAIGSRAIIDRRTIHVADVLAEADEYPESRRRALELGYRTALCVPLIHAGEAIGVIFIRRAEVRPFAERQIELVNTFADQAVIAIENTRLFEAEQTRTKELTESLEYQTATSEVLAVISRSPNALQPVVDSISETAVRLCGADWAFIRTLGPDGQYHAVSFEGVPGKFVDLMLSRTLTPGRGLIAGRALLERRTIHVDDVFADPDCSEEQLEIAHAGQFHTVLAVPLLRAGEPIGVIVLLRTKVAPFSKRQIDLVSTFADQAEIAINNVGLFEEVQARTKELQESLEYQTATSEVLSVISRSPDKLQPVLDEIAVTSARLCDAEFSMLFRVEADLLPLVANNKSDAAFVQYCIDHPVPYTRNSNTGRAAVEGHTIHTADVRADPENTREEATRLGGQRTVLSVPLLGDGRAVGVITLMRSEVKPFTQRQIALVETFADQAVIAINNVGLFEEVQARTRELAKTVEDLEIASQHKNQFVANMSHELRTPLAAILGYAELIQEGFYEPQGPKSLDALTRIRSNGMHLLGLINTVLDIAKIESGQFTLNMAEYAIESVIETVRSATESLAQNKKLAFKTEVTKSLPVGVGDEQRLTQVLLNLVGNAIKFTDVGEVRVTAKAVNGHFNVSVIDTGPGIPMEHQTRIFDQFHQVDSSNTKAKGGTGLGLAIARQIVEMHGGRIWVESTVGKGSTFQMELPTRAEFRKTRS